MFNLSQLPPEILVKIISYLKLRPENALEMRKINKNFASFFVTDNLFWKEKFKQHFPHALDKLNAREGEVNWLDEFHKIYKKEYPEDSFRKKLLSLIKEGHIEEIVDEIKKLNMSGVEKLQKLRGADSNAISILQWAREKGHQLLLDYFYQLAVEIYTEADISDIKKNTGLLHWALQCQQSLQEIIIPLVEKGVNLRSGMHIEFYKVGFYREAPLYVPAQNGRLDVVRFLLGKNVDVDKLSNGKTPLYIATQNGHYGIVKLLLENNADVNRPNVTGKTSLHVAAKKGHFDLVKLHVENNADVNQPDTKGKTSLYTAVKKHYFEVVQFLLEHGANINQVINKAQDTQFHIAVRKGQLDVVKFWLEHDADVNQMNRIGETPLHAAVLHGQRVDIVNALLERDADIYAENDHGDTPLSLAMSKKGCWGYITGFFKPERDISPDIVEAICNQHKRLKI